MDPWWCTQLAVMSFHNSSILLLVDNPNYFQFNYTNHLGQKVTANFVAVKVQQRPKSSFVLFVPDQPLMAPHWYGWIKRNEALSFIKECAPKRSGLTHFPAFTQQMTQFGGFRGANIRIYSLDSMTRSTLILCKHPHKNIIDSEKSWRNANVIENIDILLMFDVVSKFGIEK